VTFAPVERSHIHGEHKPSADQAIGLLGEPLYRIGCQLTTLTHNKSQASSPSMLPVGCTSRCYQSWQFADFRPEVLVLPIQNANPEKGDLHLTELAAARSGRDASLSYSPAKHISSPDFQPKLLFCPDTFAAFRRYPGKGDLSRIHHPDKGDF
jgi:hypothetical protein